MVFLVPPKLKQKHNPLTSYSAILLLLKVNSIRTTLNIVLAYDPVIILLGVYPNELKTSVHAKTCPQIFTVAVFVTAKK